MKVFVVFYTDQDAFELYHIASTKEKAEAWVKRHKEEYFMKYVEIEEVDVDKEEKLGIY